MIQLSTDCPCLGKITTTAIEIYLYFVYVKGMIQGKNGTKASK